MPDSSPPTELTEEQRVALRRTCRVLNGHREQRPHERFAALAEWSAERAVEPDHYAAGGLLTELELRVAELLGFPAGAFFPSGTMAQGAALLVHAERRGGRAACRIAMHPTAHPLNHEQDGWRHLLGLDVVPLGAPRLQVSRADLAATEGVDLLFLELPLREAGGLLPTHDELDGLLADARERGMALHLDGARLWEASVGLGRTPAEIAAGFDSVYVSLYKGVGGLSGAMLVGDAPLIDEARVWRRRMGGTLPNQVAPVAAAAARLDETLAALPRWLTRAREVAAHYARAGAHVRPEVPHTNLFHVVFDVPREALLAARNAVAEELGVWLFGWVAELQDEPERSRIELYCAEQAVELEDAALVPAIELLFERARTLAG